MPERVAASGGRKASVGAGSGSRVASRGGGSAKVARDSEAPVEQVAPAPPPPPKARAPPPPEPSFALPEPPIEAAEDVADARASSLDDPNASAVGMGQEDFLAELEAIRQQYGGELSDRESALNTQASAQAQQRATRARQNEATRREDYGQFLADQRALADQRGVEFEAQTRQREDLLGEGRNRLEALTGELRGHNQRLSDLFGTETQNAAERRSKWDTFLSEQTGLAEGRKAAWDKFIGDQTAAATSRREAFDKRQGDWRNFLNEQRARFEDQAARREQAIAEARARRGGGGGGYDPETGRNAAGKIPFKVVQTPKGPKKVKDPVAKAIAKGKKRR